MRQAEPVMPEFTWRDIASVLATAMLIGGLVIGWVKWRLSSDFASKADVGDVQRRLEAIEQQMRLAPTHADFSGLSIRVAAVERGVDVGNAELRGLREGQVRIERDLSMLVQHHLRTDT